MPKVDEDGVQLLRHARVYTLAERFAVPALKVLSQSKIHCINSTAKGEIAYARYVYANTTGKDDAAVRGPIAHFWATRSHTLRSEAEEEFRDLCLEFPQFGYDVLSESPRPCRRLRPHLLTLPARVLDEKLKRERSEKLHPTAGSSRKRARHTNV